MRAKGSQIKRQRQPPDGPFGFGSGRCVPYNDLLLVLLSEVDSRHRGTLLTTVCPTCNSGISEGSKACPACGWQFVDTAKAATLGQISISALEATLFTHAHSQSERIAVVPKGTRFEVLSFTRSKDDKRWFVVRSSSGENGYIAEFDADLRSEFFVSSGSIVVHAEPRANSSPIHTLKDRAQFGIWPNRPRSGDWVPIEYASGAGYILWSRALPNVRRRPSPTEETSAAGIGPLPLLLLLLALGGLLVSYFAFGERAVFEATVIISALLGLILARKKK